MLAKQPVSSFFFENCFHSQIPQDGLSFAIILSDYTISLYSDRPSSFMPRAETYWQGAKPLHHASIHIICKYVFFIHSAPLADKNYTKCKDFIRWWNNMNEEFFLKIGIFVYNIWYTWRLASIHIWFLTIEMTSSVNRLCYLILDMLKIISFDALNCRNGHLILWLYDFHHNHLCRRASSFLHFN